MLPFKGVKGINPWKQANQASRKGAKCDRLDRRYVSWIALLWAWYRLTLLNLPIC